MSVNRQVVLDTETTGLETRNGNRIVEIGCIEMINRRPTGRVYHTYLMPDRDFEAGAQQVTGLSLEFLEDKPRFAEVVDDFLDFVEGAELLIHNAPFDVGFIDYEMSLLNEPDKYGSITELCKITDTLRLAKQTVQGRSSLDALCKRFGVDNSGREFHGALLDAQLLQEVYIALTSGQSELGLAANASAPSEAAQSVYASNEGAARPKFINTPDDMAAHLTVLERLRNAAQKAELKSGVIWDRIFRD